MRLRWSNAAWAAFSAKQAELGGMDAVSKDQVLRALADDLVVFLDSYRDAVSDHEVDGAGRRGDAEPSRLVIEVPRDYLAQGLRVSLGFGVGGPAVADDQRHDASVANPLEAS